MRSLLRPVVLLLALLLPAATAACTLAAPGAPPDDDTVAVLGPWTGIQEKRFTELLKGFGIPFTYQGTAAQREVLLSQLQTGTAPDVAIMPGVGELAEYAADGHLKPLTWLAASERNAYGSPWQPRPADGKPYWLPVKADLKSIVWYREDSARPTAPAPAAAWCIGMGDDGASGWPGSDWIEDLVLQSQGPEVYEDWVNGAVRWTDRRIVTAWQAWGRMIAQGGKALQARALLTDHRGSPSGARGLLFGGQDCTREHQGSFAPAAFYGDKAPAARFTDSAPLLPGGPYRQRGHEVSADFAVLFNDTPQARALLRTLVSRTGQQAWTDQDRGRIFSARTDVAPAADAGTAARLTGRTGAARCLDASDAMSPAVRDAFYDSVLEYLADPDSERLEKEKLPGLQKVSEAERARAAKLGKPRGLTGVCDVPR
ncbi:extracellular solute-binding protein [Streptomyces sp. NPDC087440]|uniref:extracellular solute-binding protein n=1 Tax=Streptomyces sp. NPDC087440 TaxID=3365790 RepID=UPI003827A88F